MYTSCVVSGQQPNVWLRSNPITIPGAVIQVYITIQYHSKNCTMLGGDDFSRESFDLYVHQSWNKEVPEPPWNNSTYSKIAKITAPIPGVYERVTKRLVFQWKEGTWRWLFIIRALSVSFILLLSVISFVQNLQLVLAWCPYHVPWLQQTIQNQ